MQGGDLADAFIQSDVQPFIHRQPRRATASSSGAVRVRRLTEGPNQQPSGYKPAYLPSHVPPSHVEMGAASAIDSRLT